MRHFT